MIYRAVGGEGLKPVFFFFAVIFSMDVTCIMGWTDLRFWFSCGFCVLLLHLTCWSPVNPNPSGSGGGDVGGQSLLSTPGDQP